MLVEEVVDRLKKENNIEELEWIPEAEAMKILGIRSKSTLSKLRNEGSIRYSQPSRKLILYYRHSIYEYLEKHAKETF